MAIVEIWKVPLPRTDTARAESHAALRHISADRRGLATSLSHSEQLALVAVAKRPVGVDLEHIGNAPTVEDLDDLAFLTLSEHERRHLVAAPAERQAIEWLQLWTRKEAVLKAGGRAAADAAIRDLDALGAGVRELDVAPGYVGALATTGDDDGIVWRTYPND